MPQEQHEFLNESDFNQNVSHADADEIPKVSAYASLGGQLAAEEERRQSQNHECAHQADAYQTEQQGHGAVDLRILGARLVQEAPKITGLDGIEEKWAVV